MESSSANDLIFSALASQKQSEFAFITITNPSDLKDARKQTAIRRHARLSTNSSKKQRRKYTELVFDLSDAAPQITTEDNRASATSINAIQNVETTYGSNVEGGKSGKSDSLPSLDGLSWTLLRPISSGRGLLPLQPFPTSANSRMRDLTNFGLNLARSLVKNTADPFKYTREAIEPINLS
jgi:hypothetical protein